MSIGYFEFVLSLLILADNLQFSDPCFTDMLDIDSLVDSPIESSIWPHIGTIWCNTDMFHLKLLIFFSLSIAGSNLLAHLRSRNRPILCLKPSGSPALLHQVNLSGLLCVDHIAIFLCQHTFWHARWCRCFTTDSLPWGYPGQYCSGFGVC